jgi:tetrapyrrole methylase family protein/MazG family protein
VPSSRSKKRTLRHKRPKKKKAGAKRAASKSARRQTSGRSASKKPVGRLFEHLVAVQARLRAPGGCPWDREQTHATLKTYLIEEAYEVLEAIENAAPQELKEELGDLLLQVLFHADLALEAGHFDISDVVLGIHDKMIRRHPHVFGDVKVNSSNDVLRNWAQLKAAEKEARSAADILPKPIAPSVLDGIPRSLPALLEAYQLTRRASQVGFDWDQVDGIFAKMIEETAELRAALDAANRANAEDEMGDILFVAVNLARFLGFDPEVALKQSNLKFKSRFQDMDKEAERSGQRLAQLSKEELELLWNAAKIRSKTPVSAGSKK